MKFNVEGVEIHASTGGREHKPDQPYVIFVHGSGQSRLTWTQQVRLFAYGGYNVIAPDLPGHGLSGGEAIFGIAEQGDWIAKMMDALKIDKAHLVGHSQGGIIVLETAAQHPKRIQSVSFIATAAAIPTNEQLIKMAEEAPQKAFNMMISWGSGQLAHKGDNTVPGASLIGAGLQNMALNSPAALPTDLRSCAAYGSGMEQAASLNCPTLCILAEEDRMTPCKFGKKFAENLPQNQLQIIAKAGHMLPVEHPVEVNRHLRAFLEEQIGAA